MTAVKLGCACAILGLPSRFHGNQTIVRLFENKFGIITSKSLTEKNNPRFRISKSYYLDSRHDMCVCVKRNFAGIYCLGMVRRLALCLGTVRRLALTHDNRYLE
jgi:hypothetical protein